MLDLVLAAVAEAHQPLDQLDRVELVARVHDDRFDLLDVRAEALQQRPHRRHDHRRQAVGARPGPVARPVGAGRVGGGAQPPQRAQAATHRGHRGAHPLEREGLPRAEHLDLVLAEVGREVVGQLVGVAGGGHGDDDRTAARQLRQAGDGDGPGRLGDRQQRGGAPERAEEPGFVPEEGGERGEVRGHGEPDQATGAPAGADPEAGSPGSPVAAPVTSTRR